MAALERAGERGLEIGALPSLAGDAFRGPRLATAILVFAGYYLGARLGLALTFSPLPISVLWPPNAILFAALLLVPTRNWWVVALAALPAHLATELQAGIPTSMVLCWYVSNLSEALIGAGLVRLFAGRSNPFESPRNAILFFVAAGLAAVFSSFLDSAFVRMNGFGSTGFWDLWKSRVVSNLVADTVIAPAIITCVAVLARPIPAMAPARAVEGIFLSAATAIVALLVFDSQLPAGAAAGQIFLPVPLFLWAAFRFGPAGASLSYSIVVLIAIWGAGHGIGALGQRSPLENVHSLQIFALSLGPALLCFAAALEERDRGVQALRSSNAMFRLVLEATRDTVYERNLATDALHWSHNGPLNLGYGGEESLHSHPRLVEAIHPEDRQRIAEQHESALRGGQRAWELEYRLRRADGSYAHVQEHAFVVASPDGQARELVGRLVDVTERRDTEELGQRLAQASRLTSMGELAASIAHEINQPMGAILANVDAAESLLQQPQLSREELRAVLADIRSDDLRAAEIVRHIRNLANKRSIEVSHFDLNKLVDTVIRLAARTARARGILIRTELEPLPTIIGDEIHIQQVLLNLLFNAMDAMGETRPGARVVTVGTSLESPDTARICVRDRGHGIPPEQMAKIFDSFFTTKPDGMGLGLSISRSLVLAHGGRIWAQNNADGGATVCFALPAHKTE